MLWLHCKTSAPKCWKDKGTEWISGEWRLQGSPGVDSMSRPNKSYVTINMILHSYLCFTYVLNVSMCVSKCVYFMYVVLLVLILLVSIVVLLHFFLWVFFFPFQCLFFTAPITIITSPEDQTVWVTYLHPYRPNSSLLPSAGVEETSENTGETVCVWCVRPIVLLMIDSSTEKRRLLNSKGN